MTAVFYALITVLAWGTWLTPAQNVRFQNQQVKTFYVAAANLVLAFIVAGLQDFSGLSWPVFWLPFMGGLIWSVSGLCAFSATATIGTARAFGIWAPINIIVSMLWGALLFGEFVQFTSATIVLLGAALVIILAGVLMVIFSRGSAETGAVQQAAQRRVLWTGFLYALGAGVLWGSYFIPIQMSNVSMWVASFPLAVGIFTGSSLLFLITRKSAVLEKPSDYARAAITGLLWGVGNYGMLLLVDQLGAGKGFTISQLSVVVNALIGVYLLKDPHPKSRAAVWTLTGCVLATVGGVILGSLR